jgi:hypothetical protein
MHRYRIAFISGLAAGFVLGTRAGRERYEQLKKLARRAADSPAVQQAAGALQAQGADLLKSARQKVTRKVHDSVPKLTDKARQKVADRVPRRRGAASAPSADATPEVAGQRLFAATSDPGNGRSTG